MEVIRARALRDLGDDEDNSNWVRLFLEYTIGRARSERLHLPRIDLGDLTTIEGIQNAVQVLSEAQGTGLLAEEECESYRRTIDRAMAAIRLAQGDEALGAMEAMEAMAATTFTARADATPEEAAAEFQDFMRAREAQVRDN